MADKKKPVGLTKNTGWQIGLRRTLDRNSQWLWEFLTSSAGLRIWLGPGEPFPLQEGAVYQLKDGTTGEVRKVKPGSHWRITRQPLDPAYDRPTTIQVRVIPQGKKTTLAFHEEHLPSERQRQVRKTHYLQVMEAIKQASGLT